MIQERKELHGGWTADLEFDEFKYPVLSLYNREGQCWVLGSVRTATEALKDLPKFVRKHVCSVFGL